MPREFEMVPLDWNHPKNVIVGEACAEEEQR